jgi:acyl-CoA hydrolase
MSARFYNSIEQAVSEIVNKIDGDICLGAPLGLGKPNRFINAIYQRITGIPSRSLHIFSALSLSKPTASSELEARFLDPFVERVFADYPDLDYVNDLKANKVPNNITVNEFFLKSGDWLNHANAQQHYINSNYTHIARDMAANGVNVICQAIAVRDEADGTRRYSLSCNPDLSEDLLDLLQPRRERGERIFAVGVINYKLPFMPNDAEVSAEQFDMIIDDPAGTHTLFSTPNMKVGLSDYAIGLHASSLVQDGGTLQIGIGSLGDAIVHSLILRDQDNATYQQMIKRLNHNLTLSSELEVTPFVKGLYGCSEMFVNGFLKLIQANIIRRAVYAHTGLQKLLNQGLINETVTIDTLKVLHQQGVISSPLVGEDVALLTRFGIFNDDCSFEDETITIGEQRIGTDLDDENTLAQIKDYCLGTRLQGGSIMHGGFFLGPADFYQTLRDMPDEQLNRINMSTIAFINQLYADRYGDEQLKRAQRVKARFINTCMMATLSGAAVSDALEDGRVVSGVGGQYNFVAQAHEMADARSILMLRSHRVVDGEVRSSIVKNYGHITIPRHLRDIFITEYGIADLRGKNDSDIIKALLNVSDSRCQEELRLWAVSNGKLSADYVIPKAYTNNTPEALAERLQPFMQHLPSFPFGTDFTKDELSIIKALQSLKSSTEHPLQLLKTVISSIFKDEDDEKTHRYLERMGFNETRSLKEKVMKRLFMGNV